VRNIIIAFSGPHDGTLIHRIRNFGEDLYGHFRDTGQAEMDIAEVDRVTDCVSLRLTATRHLGNVSAYIKKALKEHGLIERATISRRHANDA
jgi:hypothetical protein